MVSNKISLDPLEAESVKEFVPVVMVIPDAAFTATRSTTPAPVANKRYSPQFDPLDVTIVKRPL